MTSAYSNYPSVVVTPGVLSMEQQFRDALTELVIKAEQTRLRDDRTNTGTYSVFGRQWRCNLQEGFPLVTSKFVPMKAIIRELLWFLTGHTNNNELLEHGVNIWTQWALEDGSLGPVYGKQWRSWTTPDGDYDQITKLLTDLEERPFSRRLIVSAWNVADLPDEALSPKDNVRAGKMALAPCHTFFQFYVEEMTALERYNYMRSLDGFAPVEHVHESFVPKAEKEMLEREIPHRKLSCQLYQRSADICVGVPFNIASYALFTMMIAQVAGMAPGDYIHTFGDLHLYANHLEGAREWLEQPVFPQPRMHLNPQIRDIDAFDIQDFKLQGYVHGPKIPFEVAY